MTSNDRKTVFITGLDSFTGRYVAREFSAAGHRVCGTIRERGANVASRYFEYHVDLCDRVELSKALLDALPDFVIHLAAISFVPHSDIEEIYRVNVVGTRNLLEAIQVLSWRPRSILLASSANIYGNSASDPIVESSPPSPRNDYAVSKLSMEYMARTWMDSLPITIVRPFNYTGVGQSTNFLIPKIVDHFRRKAPAIELGNVNIARDFSDVRCVATAYRKLAFVAPAGEVFNVCSGKVTSLHRVLDLMREISNHDIEVKVNLQFLRESDVVSLRGSRQKLMGTIAQGPAFSIEETLRWMFHDTSS